MNFFDREEVERLFPTATAIEVMDATMRAVSAGEAVFPLRRMLPLGGGNIFGVMPCALREAPAFGAKQISIFPENTALGLGSHLRVIVLFEAERQYPQLEISSGIVAEIGETLAGRARGRRSDDEITLNRSLGVLAQDIASAQYIVANAAQRSPESRLAKHR